MENNFKIDLEVPQLSLSKNELMFINSLKDVSYKGIKETEINDSNRLLINEMLVKGILFQSNNSLNETALFLTPLGEEILNRLIYLQNVLNRRNFLINQTIIELEGLKSETDILELNMFDVYYRIYNHLNTIRDSFESFERDRIIKGIYEQRPQPDECCNKPIDNYGEPTPCVYEENFAIGCVQDKLDYVPHKISEPKAILTSSYRGKDSCCAGVAGN